MDGQDWPGRQREDSVSARRFARARLCSFWSRSMPELGEGFQLSLELSSHREVENHPRPARAPPRPARVSKRVLNTRLRTPATATRSDAGVTVSRRVLNTRLRTWLATSVAMAYHGRAGFKTSSQHEVENVGTRGLAPSGASFKTSSQHEVENKFPVQDCNKGVA